MKGLIFNLLEEAISKAFGEETWDDLLDDTHLNGAYTSLGSYPDTEVEALVNAAARRLEMSPGAVLCWFGEQAMPLIKRRYPALFERHPTSRNFILSVNNVIHVEVRKLYPNACCPFFHFKEGADGSLSLRYQSAREMFDLAHGFVLGAAALWNETVTVIRHSVGSPDADLMIIQWA